MNFDDAFTKLVDPQHEGGYVDDPKDPGGETKYGISKRAYPGEDIAGMTLDRAKLLYRRDYWGPAGCDAVPDVLKFDLLDFAVNAGVGTAIRALQRAAGAAPDGVIGQETLLRLSRMDGAALARRFVAAKIRYYTGIREELRDRYLAGWMNRIATNLEEA